MNKQEQDFEEKIRKKLSAYSGDFDEAAWEKLERRLVPERPRKTSMLAAWWFRGAAAVILAGAGVLIYSSLFRSGKPGPGPSGSQEQVTANLPAGSEDENFAAPSPGEPGAGSTGAAGDSGTADATRSAAGNTAIWTGAEIAAAGNTAVERPGSQAGSGSEGLPAGTGGDLLRPRAGSPVSVPAGLGSVWPPKEVPLSADRTPFPEGLALAEPELAAIPGAGYPGRNMSLEGRAGQAAAEGDHAAGREEEAAEDSQQDSRAGSSTTGSGAETRGIGFALGVLAAPDLNSVGGLGAGKVGYHAGLSLGLRFGDRLSLETGVVYSRKPYDASPSDYHLGRPSSSLLAVNAECDVIDIPVNLRYDFYRKGANRAGLTAGLSSYLMLSERYRYRYQDYDSRLYEYRNENQHFMGVANAGIVFERELNSKMSIGLQPFIKIPLTGIGHGKVKLISTGAAVRLNMRLGQN